jgi:hypothetical protein
VCELKNEPVRVTRKGRESESEAGVVWAAQSERQARGVDRRAPPAQRAGHKIFNTEGRAAHLERLAHRVDRHTQQAERVGDQLEPHAREVGDLYVTQTSATHGVHGVC